MIKTGIWQIIEMITIMLSIYIALANSGKPIIKELDKDWKEHDESTRGCTLFIMFILWMFLGPLIAYWGGCSGPWFMAFVGVSFSFYLYSMHIIISGKGRYMKHSVIRTLIHQVALNYLMYMGGFWTL